MTTRTPKPPVRKHTRKPPSEKPVTAQVVGKPFAGTEGRYVGNGCYRRFPTTK